MLSHTVSAIPLVSIHTIVPCGLQRIIIEKTCLEIVTPTVSWLDRTLSKANQPLICVSALKSQYCMNSLYNSPLTVLSTHRVCVLWNSSFVFTGFTHPSTS